MFAYVVTSYTNPQQTLRLARRLRSDSPSAKIVISHDRKEPPPDRRALQHVGAELWLTPQPVEWGDVSYLRSQLAAVKRLQLGEHDWVTILSGQDYLLRPLADYEAHLSDSAAHMILEEPDEDDPHLAHLLQRYRARAYRLPRWAGAHRIRQIITHIPGISMSDEPRGLPPYLLRARWRTPFSPALPLRKGSDLYALSGRAARRLQEAPPDLLRYFSRTRVPSESYVHTWLRGDPSLVNEAAMLHFTKWGAAPHPLWLTASDLPEMLASPHWFARKFQQDDPVLDSLDDILGKRSLTSS